MHKKSRCDRDCRSCLSSCTTFSSCCTNPYFDEDFCYCPTCKKDENKIVDPCQNNSTCLYNCPYCCMNFIYYPDKWDENCHYKCPYCGSIIKYFENPERTDASYVDTRGHMSYFLCPTCYAEISFFPYYLDENFSYRCPKCSTDMKYFFNPYDEDAVRSYTNYPKCCSTNRNDMLNEIDFYQKMFSRPDILKCLYLSDEYIKLFMDDAEREKAKEDLNQSENIPFSRQLPPYNAYCMYANKMDDWFTHYLMRQLNRDDQVNQSFAGAWLNKLYDLLDIDEQQKGKRSSKKWMKRLSALYNATVAPTPSEQDLRKCYMYETMHQPMCCNNFGYNLLMGSLKKSAKKTRRKRHAKKKAHSDW